VFLIIYCVHSRHYGKPRHAGRTHSLTTNCRRFMDVSPLWRFALWTFRPRTYRPLDVSPTHWTFRPRLWTIRPSQWTFRLRLQVVTFAVYYSVSWQSHVWHKYRVAHPVFLSDVLNDVIGVTTNYSADRALSNCPTQFCLGKLHVSFLRQKIGDVFMIKIDVSFSLSSHLLRRAWPSGCVLGLRSSL